MVLMALGWVLHLNLLVQIVALSMVNIIIDYFGHSAYRGVKRTAMTHSPLSAGLIGVAWGVVLYFLLPFLGISGHLLFMVIGGAVAGWSHLFLDSMTYSGIYIFHKRVAIAHFRNGPIDVPFVILSFVGILYFLGVFVGI
jgi:hypothetical protein